jgi:hypothetical protein
MTKWYGYDQPERAHPKYPWWRSVAPHGMVLRWERTDGRTVYRARSYQEEELWAPPPGGWPSDLVTMTAMFASADDAIRAWDRERPLPRPEVLPGQVWADGLEEGPHDLYLIVGKYGNTPFIAVGAGVRAQRPLPEWKLVHGEGAPWAPPEEG